MQLYVEGFSADINQSSTQLLYITFHQQTSQYFTTEGAQWGAHVCTCEGQYSMWCRGCTAFTMVMGPTFPHAHKLGSPEIQKRNRIPESQTTWGQIFQNIIFTFSHHSSIALGSYIFVICSYILGLYEMGPIQFGFDLNQGQ